MSNTKGKAVLWGISVSSFLVVILIYITYFRSLPSAVWAYEVPFDTGDLPALVENQTEGGATLPEKLRKGDDVNRWQTCGLVGDSFGALTCLFTAFAFWGAIVTLCLQGFEQRRSSRVDAEKRLPIIVQVPKECAISFFVGRTGALSMAVQIVHDETNASSDVALHIAHDVEVSCNCGALVRRKPMYIVNNHVGGKTECRNDWIYVYDKTDIIAFLSSCIAADVSCRPTARICLGYKNFFETFGRVDEFYRIKLCDGSSDKLNVQKLIMLFKSGAPITNAAIAGILSLGRVIKIRLENLPKKSFLRCVSGAEYEKFIRAYRR